MDETRRKRKLPTATMVLVAGGIISALASPALAAPASAALPPAPPHIMAPPTATGISPDSGTQAGGTTVTITGTGFVVGATTVTFDGVAATDVTVALDGLSLTAVTPVHPVGAVDVVVTTVEGSTEPLTYTYLANGSDAVITGITPPSGPTVGGTRVTITGTGLTGAIAVDFNGLPSTGFTINPAGTEVSVIAPPNPAGPATVELIFPEGRIDAGTFTYVAPTITSIVPARGPVTGGTTVTITGTGFTGVTGVTFADVPGTDVVVDPSGTSLTVVTPAGLVGPVDVLVLLPGENASAPGGFTYQAAAPVVTAISPARGGVSGGTTVTVSGAGFLVDRTAVTICDRTIPAADITVTDNGTRLTFRTPSCAAGNTTLTVATSDGVSNAVTFRYVGPVLPVTGGAVGTRVALGLGIVLLGALLVLLTRRRSA